MPRQTHKIADLRGFEKISRLLFRDLKIPLWAIFLPVIPTTACKKKGDTFIDARVMKSGLDYFHLMYDWYMKESKTAPIAFLQLGGGISADFPICVVPSLKHDLRLPKVRDWAGFIEIGSSPMSYGSYSGAGGKEKITWDKLSTQSYYQIIQSDVTLAFPWIAAVLLGL